MALLVTGAMGHVGLEVVRQAAAAGETVVAQYRKTFRERDARDLPGTVTWTACDLADRDAVENLGHEHSIDRCIHCAAVPNEQLARPQPLAAIRANVGGVANLLETARRRNWQRLVCVSTGSVFQNAVDVTQPIREDAPPSVANVYSTTKYCGELLIQMYRSQFGLSAAVVRVSWVYGPPLVSVEPPRGPVPLLLKAALSGERVRLPSGGDFAASFTYVADVAAGLIAAGRAGTLNFDVYHLGSGVNHTAREVAHAVCAAVPGAVIELGPGTEPWAVHTRIRGPLAGDRLQRDTGFAVAYPLPAGIAAFADWMRAHPETFR